MEHDTSRDERVAVPASRRAIGSIDDTHIDEVDRFVHRRRRAGERGIDTGHVARATLDIAG